MTELRVAPCQRSSQVKTEQHQTVQDSLNISLKSYHDIVCRRKGLL